MHGFKHKPYGEECPYSLKSNIERDPAIPESNNNPTVEYAVTNPILGQRSWVEVVVNGDKRYKIRAQFQDTKNGLSYWKATFKKEKMGTTVSYRFTYGRGTHDVEYSEWYSYVVKEWIDITNSVNYGEHGFVISNGNTKGQEMDFKRLIKAEALTDGKGFYDIKLTFSKAKNEKFYGLGEHYDSLELRKNEDYYLYVYDQHSVQKKRGYAPVPFLFSNKGFGIFLDTGFMTKFIIDDTFFSINVMTYDIELTQLTAKTWENTTPEKIINDFFGITKPKCPPKWALGPWMSANQWNSQKKMESVLKKAKAYNLPATVAVIEAWSDEQTFYIFNGAEYDPITGDSALKLEDLKFKEPWPSPKKMIDEYHQNGIKVILWQIPVLNQVDNPNSQHTKDIEFAKSKHFVAKKKNGGFFKIPENRWFENSYVVDFFNDSAKKWWQKKRHYLINELNIDGFKTDGGEHLRYRDTLLDQSQSASRLRNRYPENYLQTASDMLDNQKILFSRSGYTRSPAFSLFWVGDEDSNFEAMKDNFIAGLNCSVSGNPFWGWDIAGFSGDLPSKDLYLKAVWNSVFVPIFQFHSEDPGDPEPSSERSPWNVANYYNDSTIIDVYRKAVSLRMALIPYIHREAQYCEKTGVPLTFPMTIKNPETFSDGIPYYFGRDMIIYPILEENKNTCEIKLPEGNWIHLWKGHTIRGGRKEEFRVGNRPLVFIKEDSVINLNLPDTKNLFDPNWSIHENALVYFGKEQKKLEKIKKNSAKQIHFIGQPNFDKEAEEMISIKWERLKTERKKC